jgi:hypothetical protein
MDVVAGSTAEVVGAALGVHEMVRANSPRSANTLNAVGSPKPQASSPKLAGLRLVA